MYLANYSIRATVLLASFFMAAGSGIRQLDCPNIFFDSFGIDFDRLPSGCCPYLINGSQ